MAGAIRQAAQLKPEIRLGVAVSNFAASLGAEDRTSFRNLQSQPEGPRASDVSRLTEDINRKGSRLHRSWKPYGTRVQSLLSQVQALAIAGDAMVGGAQNVIASGVWAVVRVSLTVILGYLSYFERVSSMMMRLGQSSAIHRELVQLFPNSIELKTYTCEYLIVLVDLCQKIVTHEAKGVVAQLASAISIDKDFSDFEARLTAWAALINDKTTALNSRAIIETRDSVSWLQKRAQGTTETRQDEATARRLELANFLSPDQDDFDRIWRRERKKGTVKWVFQSKEFYTWLGCLGQLGPFQDKVLVVTGPLGSGKTVLMANIVAHLQLNLEDNSSILAASFFCHHSDSRTLKPEVILGSLAYQIIKGAQDLDNINISVRGRGLEFITQCLEMLYDTRRTPNYVVLDGLDEYESQRQELTEFIDLELHSRPGFKHVDPTLQTLAKDTLRLGSSGMYLWAALQIDHLFPKYEATVMQEDQLTSLLFRLPKALRQVFDLALERIVADTHQPRIFQLIAAAARPLQVKELRTALNVQLGSRTWNTSTLVDFRDPARVLYACSGGLLELDEEDGSIFFVHHSVLTHLTEEDTLFKPKFSFELANADLRMGEICLAYLDLDVHDRKVAKVTAAPIVAADTVDKITRGFLEESGSLSKVMAMIRSRERSSTDTPSINIMDVVERIARQRTQNTEEGLDAAKDFLDYAQSHWVLHADHYLHQSNDKVIELIDKPFQKVMKGECTADTNYPWDGDLAAMVHWAQRHNHCRLFWHAFADALRSDVPVKGIQHWVKVFGQLSGDIVLPIRCRRTFIALPWIRQTYDGSGWYQPRLSILAIATAVLDPDEYTGAKLNQTIERLQNYDNPGCIIEIIMKIRSLLVTSGRIFSASDPEGVVSAFLLAISVPKIKDAYGDNLDSAFIDAASIMRNPRLRPAAEKFVVAELSLLKLPPRRLIEEFWASDSWEDLLIEDERNLAWLRILMALLDRRGCSRKIKDKKGWTPGQMEQAMEVVGALGVRRPQEVAPNPGEMIRHLP